MTIDRTSARNSGHMVLCAFLASTGYHSASWRRPGADPMVNIKPDYFASLSVVAEHAGIDAVFLADSLAIWSDVSTRPAGAIEPAVLAAAILQATNRIGVIITQSTSYNEPFNLARRLTSLDHLGNGRIGWNIVTSATREAAQNFGLADLPDHDERYRRCEEFVRVCIDLWNSWKPDAIEADPSGIWAHPNRVRTIDHAGEFYRVRGPLDVPPSPQRVPLLVQAGSSAQGAAFAARYADFIFTVQSNRERAKAFRDRIRTLANRTQPGRQVRVMPGLIPVVADTDEKAHQRLAELDDLLDPMHGVRQLERSLDLSPGTLAPDDHFNIQLPNATTNPGNQSYYQVIKDMADAGCYTVQQVARLMSTSRGHRLVVGSAATVAAKMIDWIDAGAADGYILMPAALPDDLHAFAENVVPILRSRSYLPLNPPDGPLAMRFRGVNTR